MQKAHILDFFGLQAITEHLWHCCKIKKESLKLWLILTSDDFLMMSAMMLCELVRKKALTSTYPALVLMWAL